MIKYKEFKGAAYGILSSFVSRNNDVNGYWGIGQLYSHAISHNVKKITINLLSQELTPHEASFQKMINKYFTLLCEQCCNRNIPISCALEANIYIQFGLETNGLKINPLYIYVRGNPFKCSVKIKDERRRIHIAQMIGRCSPHSPAKEQKSARAH